MDFILGDYNSSLVIGSVMIAIFSSYASLLIVRRMMQNTSKTSRHVWLAMGSLVFGAGIWCMHFVAMLAYEMDMAVSYEPSLLIVSILFAALSSFMAFFILARYEAGSYTLPVGALLISLGILSMHYVGMEAMEMHAEISYDFWLVVGSIVIALTASYTALRLFAYYARLENATMFVGPMASALIMGFAIAGMHYTGMASATFIATDNYTHEISGWNATILGYLIAGIMMLILVFVFIHMYYERRLSTSQAKFAMSDRLYRTIVHSANDAIFTADANGRILSWNQAAETIFGFSKQDVLHQPLTMIMPESSRQAHSDGVDRFHRTGEKRVIDQTVELVGLHKDGSTIPIELSLSAVGDAKELYFTGIMRDITERKKQDERIQNLVFKDELTNLPNRRMINEQLLQAIQEAEEAGETIAVGFIDMDRFKQINDVYGHAMGDELLRQMARRMEGNLHPKDILGRQSGDEFILIAKDCSAYEISEKAKRFIKAFYEPFRIEGVEIFMTPSIGISMYPDDAINYDELIKNADVAMYLAKQLGGQQFQFFTSEINDQIFKKMKLKSGLRKALELDEFILLYQPQVSVSTNHVVGVEALIRWENKELGRVSPMEFIPLAEETNLILPIGEWVIRQACTDFMEWMKKGYEVESLSVNISAIQFQQEDFLQIVERVLNETGMPPSKLVLEVTETVVQNVEKSLPILHKLKKMNVKLSLDDFGTGYSSLQYLKDFPLDSLKIDKSFIQSLLTSSKNQAVVDTIIAMAERLNMSIVAEGVETSDQLHYLSTKEGIHYQGYYFSPPVDSEELMEKMMQTPDELEQYP